MRKQKPEPREPLGALHARIHDLESQLPEVPALPQFWCQDITPEHLGTKLAEQNGRLGLLSAEGGIFENFAGRYSKGIANLDLLLQAHEGSPGRVERGSRAVYLDRPTITICIAPQPEVLKSFSNHPEFRGRGLVARFLYALPQSLLGIRTHNTAPVPNLTREEYDCGIRALLNVPTRLKSDGQPDPEIIYLSKQALPQWKDFQRSVERQLSEGQRLSRCTDWAGDKLPGQALRLAAILHYAAYPFGKGPKEIQLQQTEQALALADVLTTHTLAALQLMELDPAVEDARRILRWIYRIEKPQFTVRDCFHFHQGHFKRVDAMDPAMDILLRHGYVRPLPQEKKLGRPTGLYEVNPSALEAKQ